MEPVERTGTAILVVVFFLGGLATGTVGMLLLDDTLPTDACRHCLCSCEQNLPDDSRSLTLCLDNCEAVACAVASTDADTEE